MALRSCIIVGAGLSGLVAAQQLQAQDVQVTVLDKARGVGGRMATRRIDGGVFDHGAQYFTVREARFAKLVEDWIAAGVATEWGKTLSGESTSIDSLESAQATRNPRYRGTGGMTDIPKYLARNLDVRLEQTVSRVALESDGWTVETKEGLKMCAEALLLTPPIPQTLALLDASQYTLPAAVRAELDAVGGSYLPCFAVMVLLDGPSNIPEPGRLWLSGDPVSWMADNYLKGISPGAHAVTIHAGTDFSRKHFDDDLKAVAEMLLEASDEWLGSPVRTYQTHRWRYSIPEQTYHEPYLWLPEKYPLLLAGEAFFGPRVEGAVVSGLSAAQRLLSEK
ncbi:MAG: FAD-dependent oxidoreductase [Chloroflexi bacterium]|nr:FAD-dependent oxidoreductase [Chloroflexota bacterium]